VGRGSTHEPDTVAERLWRLHVAAAETYAVLAQPGRTAAQDAPAFAALEVLRTSNRS
jgi:hypothetical protein